ncbi:MAG TPA: hypothetical protein VIJ18_18465 [Microbacteriaceae bacterium]
MKLQNRQRKFRPAHANRLPELTGHALQVNFGGNEAYSTKTTQFLLPTKLAKNEFALDGAWSLQTQYATPAAEPARIRLNYTGDQVRMVLAGSGTLAVTNGTKTTKLTVSGTPRSYLVEQTTKSVSGTLNVTVGTGVRAYSFTFG